MPLRPPGESLRKKIEEINDRFDAELGATMLICGGAVMYLCTAVFDGRINGKIIVFVILCQTFAIFLMWRKLLQLQEKLWSYRMGFDGERIVGEELNRLIGDGFQVFHDLPFDGYNVDHVIVGPPGVYAIETKTRRKPAHLKGIEKAKVIYDGTALHFPGKTPETAPIEQALRSAKSVARFLSFATGEVTQVKAILTLPGWWVERKARGVVNVLNPKEIRRSFPEVDEPLPPERIQRIVHQLTERCRVATLESSPRA